MPTYKKNVHARGLKTLDTIGNCLRPVFSLGVSQHALNNKPVKITAQSVVEVAR